MNIYDQQPFKPALTRATKFTEVIHLFMCVCVCVCVCVQREGESLVTVVCRGRGSYKSQVSQSQAALLPSAPLNWVPSTYKHKGSLGPFHASSCDLAYIILPSCLRKNKWRSLWVHGLQTHHPYKLLLLICHGGCLAQRALEVFDQ